MQRIPPAPFVRRFWFLAVLLSLGAGSLLAPGCQRAEAPAPTPQAEAPAARTWSDGDVVLRFADEEITLARLKGWYAAQARTAEETFERLNEEGRRSVVHQLGLNRLLAKEARARGLESSEAFQMRFRAWLYRELPRLWVEREITAKVNPTDRELLYEAPPALPDVRVRVGVLPDMESARRIYERARGGEDFETLVRNHTFGMLAAKGGLTDWLNTGSTVMFLPPDTQRFLDAGPGALLEPFYHDVGFVVVRVEETRTADQVRQAWLDLNRESLVLEKRQKAYRERVDALFAATEVQWDEAAVEAVLADDAEAMGRVVLRVGGQPFEAGVILQEVTLGQHGEDPVRARLRNFAQEAVISLDAVRLGLDRDPGLLARQESVTDDLLAREFLAAVGDAAAAGDVTEAELKAYYEARPDEFTQPETRTLRLIQVGSEATARVAADRLARGEDFGAVARELSIHGESAGQGGEIGAFPKKDLPAPLREPVFALPAGGVTAPLEVASEGVPSWLLVRVDAVQEAAPVPFEWVKAHRVEGAVRTLRRSQAVAAAVESAKQTYGYRNCYTDPC